jgi:hypothetical protein
MARELLLQIAKPRPAPSSHPNGSVLLLFEHLGAPLQSRDVDANPFVEREKVLAK